MNKKLVIGTIVLTAGALIAGGTFGILTAIGVIAAGIAVGKELTALNDRIKSLNETDDFRAKNFRELKANNERLEAMAGRYMTEREEFKNSLRDANAKLKEIEQLNSLAVDVEPVVEVKPKAKAKPKVKKSK